MFSMRSKNTGIEKFVFISYYFIIRLLCFVLQKKYTCCESKTLHSVQSSCVYVSQESQKRLI